MTHIEELKEPLAINMWKRGVFGFVEPPGLPLKSGRISPYYYNDRSILSSSADLDKRGVMTRVEQSKFREMLIGACAGRLLAIRKQQPYDHIMGVAQAETVLGGLIAQRSAKSYLWQRVEIPNQSHGAVHKPIEGDFAPGETVLIAENSITSGGSTIEAIDDAHRQELEPVAVFTQFDRQEGGSETIKTARQLDTFSLMTLSELVMILVQHDQIGDRELDSIADYHQKLRDARLVSTYQPPR